jgi:hypothetical protein
MRMPWRREARLIEPKLMISLKILELQTAKEILAEVFHALPADVEDMIQMRLEERSLPNEENIWPEESEEKLWPAAFCVGE